MPSTPLAPMDRATSRSRSPPPSRAAGTPVHSLLQDRSARRSSSSPTPARAAVPPTANAADAPAPEPAERRSHPWSQAWLSPPTPEATPEELAEALAAAARARERMRQQQQQQQQQPPEAPLPEPAFPAYPMLTTNLAWNSSVQIREHLSVTIEALDNMLADVINVRRALSRLSTRRPWPGGWSLNLLEMEIRDFMMGGGRMTLAEIHTRLDVEAANLRMRLEGLMLMDAEDLPPAHVIESEQGSNVPLTPTQRYMPPAPA